MQGAVFPAIEAWEGELELMRAEVVSIAEKSPQRRPRSIATFDGRDMAVVSAICNRVSRMLGLNDRQGLCEDLDIVQQNCPLNLEALAASSDRVFVDELMSILDATDRATRSLAPDFHSRFKVEDFPATML